MDLPHSFVEGVREIKLSIKKYIPTPKPWAYSTGGYSSFISAPVYVHMRV